MREEKNTSIHQGRLISVASELVKLPNGNSTRFDIVRHPGGAVVAAMNEQKQLCMIKQWRHAVNQFIWEFPAGCLEANEAPIATAKRELAEETGLQATIWHNLGSIVTSPGFCDEVLYLFFARGLTEGEAHLDPAEELEVHWLGLAEINQLIAENKLFDAKSLALYLRIQSLVID